MTDLILKIESPWNLVINTGEEVKEECLYCGRKFKPIEEGPGVDYCSPECFNFDNYDDDMRREAE